jgi:hypothetical protein
MGVSLIRISISRRNGRLFLLEVDRGSMPVVRSNFERTSFNRKLLVYWEAWKKKLHIEQFGVSQIRVLTIADSAKRAENMLSAVDAITAGKGTNFFLFACHGSGLTNSALNREFISGRRQKLRLID